jgi:hypothetical protein
LSGTEGSHRTQSIKDVTPTLGITVTAVLNELAVLEGREPVQNSPSHDLLAGETLGLSEGRKRSVELVVGS